MNSLLKFVLLLFCVVNGWCGDLRVVCFGDSTTAPRDGVSVYCDQIRQPGLQTINRGVRGNTTEAARARFAADVLEAKPDIVILQFGINDSTVDVWKTPPATAPRVPVERFQENLTYFIRTLRASGCKVIVMTFNPLAWTDKMREMYAKPPYDTSDPMGFNAGRAPYLHAIRDIAKASGAILLDVDAAYRAYASEPGHSLNDLLLDGIHPNTMGQQLTSNLLRTALRQ